jgi:Arc/MetJ-type ribon-helix-helix transcriptional regulator
MHPLYPLQGSFNLVRKGYRNLSIPEQLFIELQNFVKQSKGKYVSVAEVVREAIREFLEEHKRV